MEVRCRAFGVIAIAVFISLLDLFIVNIAFPDLQREFAGANLSQLSWVLNAYAIVYAALMVPFGKLGDLYGRRRVFQVGLLAFSRGIRDRRGGTIGVVPRRGSGTAGSGRGGADTELSRAAAADLPGHPAGHSHRAVGGAKKCRETAAGPPLGGLLVEVSWRLIFLVNIPLDW